MKPYSKLIIAILVLTAVLSLGTVSAFALENSFISVEAQQEFETSNAVQKSIALGEGEELSVDEYAQEGFLFYTSNASVAAVSADYKITGVSKGSAVITVVKGNIAVAVINVTVKGKPDYYLNAASVMAVGQKQEIRVVFHSDTFSNYSSFTSSNPSVASVDSNGIVTAKTRGSTTIRYTAYNGSSQSVNITVKPRATAVYIYAWTVSLTEGEGFNMNGRVNDGAYPSKIFYSSANSSVASVDSSGRVTAKGEGKTYITAYTDGGISRTCTVYVYGKNAIELNRDATKISFDYSNVTKINYGKSVYSRNLEAFVINGGGNNSKTIFCTFAVHGFEDSYAHDGKVLVETANKLVEYFAKNPDKLGNYRLVIVPCVNPDGTIDGKNNQRACSTAFGRCTANHIDINRDFMNGEFNAQESRYLKSLMQDYSMDIYLDFHGWLNSVLGDGELVDIFRSTNGLSKDQTGSYGSTQGYIIGWAKQNLGAKSALVELKSPSSVNYQNVANGIERAVSSSEINKPSGIVYQYSSSIPRVNNAREYSATDTEITLTWDSVSGAKAYQIQIYQNGEWVHCLNVFGATHATVSGLKSGTDYSFRVRAFTYSGNVRTYSKNWSETFICTTKPHKVYGLTVVGRSLDAREIRFSWTPQLDADGYIIYIKGNGKWVRLDTIQGGASCYYTFTGATPGYEYYFKAVAYKGNAINAGSASNELHTCAACETMNAPSVNAINDKTIRVDWELVGSHGYVVMWSTDPTFKTGTSHKYITGHSVSNYTITVPSDADQYYVRVRAWRNWDTGKVYGAWSEGAKSGDAAAKVTGLATTARGSNGSTLTISWDAQANADSYNVYAYNKPADSWTYITTVATNKYIDETVTPGYEYNYRVVAVKDGVEGMPSDALHTCAACETMKAPTVQKNGSQIKVGWELVGSHGYVVMWSTDPTFKTGVSHKYITGHSVNNYTITGINSNQTYYVRVRAWRNWDTGYVYGAWSDSTTA